MSSHRQQAIVSSTSLDVRQTYIIVGSQVVFRVIHSSHISVPLQSRLLQHGESGLWLNCGLTRANAFESSSQTVAQRKPIYIVSASRTPIGSFLGALSSVSAVELGTQVVKHVMKKIDLDPKEVDEVFFGQVVQAGAGQSPARQVALGAGIPDTTDATTINKVCASGMKSIMLAAQTMSLGDNECMVAGGMESMSKAP